MYSVEICRQANQQRAQERLDLWSFAGVLGRVTGQVSGGRYAAGHGPQQGRHLVEGHPGHDVVPAPSPASPAEGHLAQS